MELLYPGQICPESGNYYMVDRFGRRHDWTYWVNAGDRMPPTPCKGMRYMLADAVVPLPLAA